MSRSAAVPCAASAAARPTRHGTRRPDRGTSHPGPGAPAASAETRNRPGALFAACLAAGAFALLVPDGDSHAQSRIGRLFSTPEQRAELDRLRVDSSAKEVAAPAPEPPPRASQPVSTREAPALAATLNGVVVRGDGHRVTWIDGIETAAGGSTPAGIRVESEPAPDSRLRIRLSLGRTTAVLAPGQFVDENGRVRNGYERPPTAAAGPPDEGATHSNREIPSAAAPVEPRQTDSPLLPAHRVQDPPQGTRAPSAPSDE